MDAARRLPASGLALMACVAGAAGCGKGDTTTTSETPPTAVSGDQREIHAVIDRLTSASRASDGATICHALVTHALKLSIQRASHAPCSKAVARAIGGPKTRFRTGPIAVKSTYGLAEVTDQAGRRSHLIMQKTEGGWRIARIVR